MREDVMSSVLNRPSQSSAVEMRRYRARFDNDRQSQLLSASEARLLTESLMKPDLMYQLDQCRIMLGRAALRHLGLINHSLASYDWYLRTDLPHLIRRMKPWIIANGPRVHVFKIVRAFIASPETLSDENEGQYVPLSPHEARLASTPYDSLILVDVAHWVYASSRGASASVHSSAPGATGATTSKFTLPNGWMNWPLESSEIYLRQPFHKIGTLTMSWIDRRMMGTLRPEAFAYEDPTDQGGIYMAANSAVVMPQHETLMHNTLFSFPAGSYAAGNDGCETPDLSEPFELRQQKAIVGARMRLSKYHRMEIRAIHASRRQRSTSTIVIRMSKYKRNDRDKLGGQHVTLHMQFLAVSLPPTVVFMALGFDWEESVSMMKQVAGPHWYIEAFEPMLRKMLARHPVTVKTKQDACMYIADRAEKTDFSDERKLAYANTFLQTEFMPQIGLSLTYNRDKALYLAHIIVSLFMVACGYAFYHSKDSYFFQRYDGNGTMWSSLQRQVSYKVHTSADRALRTAIAGQLPLQFRTIFSEQKTSDQIAGCLAKGSWSVNRFLTGSSRTGATLALKTTNWLTYASSVRRSNTANKAHRRSISARQVDEAQYGRLCAVETPEGEQCGIARFKACGATLSVASSGKALLGLLRHAISPTEWRRASDPPDEKDPMDVARVVLVDLDGYLVWRVTETTAIHILSNIRRWRRSGLVSPHVGCNIDMGGCCGRPALQIRTCPGRNVRLLIVLSSWLKWQQQCNLSNMQKEWLWGLTLPDALRRGVLEYIDALEERSLSICFSFDDFLKRTCVNERFSHMEVEPSWMLGVTAGSLPHSDHNQSPRSVLGSAMSKQTFSGVLNPFRLHTTQHILEYPQRPLCETRILDDFQNRYLCTGQMVRFVVAATDHTMEDSWGIQSAATQLGLFRCTLQRRYVAANKPSHGSMGLTGTGRIERFEKPDKTCVGLQDANYSRIGADGLPAVGTWLEPEDIVIGRTYRDARTDTNNWNNNGNGSMDGVGVGVKHDNSISVRDERGVVQSVGSVTTDSGMFHLKEVVMRTPCLNEIGDKSFCRHGQKGTTGSHPKASNCYTSVVSGQTAVIEMNPIGILARMTDGQLTEQQKSTAGAIAGTFINATPFLSKAQKDREINVVATLLSVGAQRLGYERFINGMTGELTQPLLTGLVYMSPLVHLVGNKIHARNRGPRKLLTRQPDDGRSKHGGLRFGQMEVDAFAALGAARFLVERLKTTSDEYLMPVCSQCGLIAEVCRERNYGFCRTCFTGEHVGIVSVSYSQKLFYQELYALHIKPQLILADEVVAPQGGHQPPTGPTTVVGPVTKAAYSYYDLLDVPEPEAWEWKSMGIEPPKNLRQKLQEMSALVPPAFGNAPTPRSRPSTPSTQNNQQNLMPPPLSPLVLPSRPAKRRLVDSDEPEENNKKRKLSPTNQSQPNLMPPPIVLPSRPTKRRGAESEDITNKRRKL